MAFEYANYIWRKTCDPELYKKYFRQPAEITKAIRKQPGMRREMLRYAKDFPVCEACGYKKIQVHHKKPASSFPRLAALYSNFMSLCWHCHRQTLGHPRGTRSYNPNIEQDLVTLRALFQQMEDECIVTKSHKWFEKQLDN